jgi:hypothetical protein
VAKQPPKPKEPKPARQRFVPLPEPERCDLPPIGNSPLGRPPIVDVWGPVIQKVRAANGDSLKIAQHPRGSSFVRDLRKKFPDVLFASRRIDLGDGQHTYGIWAWLVRPDESKLPPKSALPPVDAALERPVF